MNEILSFYDEKGNLIPLENIQKSIEEIYTDIEKEQSKVYSKDSVLAELITPEAQFSIENAIDNATFVDRAIYINDAILPENAGSINKQINFWNIIDDTDEIPTEERVPIKLYINTPGGDLPAALSIIDTIILSRTPVWTITLATGYSAGFFIGIAGHKRFAYPHSSFLFHEGCFVNGGDAHKFLQGANFYEKQLKQLKKLVLDRTNITEEMYEEHKKDDLWLLADEALKYNIVDEIMTEI